MQYLKLREKLPFFFTVRDVEETLHVEKASARMLASRYTQKKIFLRLRRDLYIFTDDFRHLYRFDFFPLSAKMKPASYISFSSALLYYGVFHGFLHSVEAVNLQHKSERRIDHQLFQFYKLPKKYFFSFEEKIEKTGEFLIATPEKALLDLFYLYSLGRYYVSLRHINLERIDFKKLFNLSGAYPLRTQKLLAHLYNRAQNKRAQKKR